MAQLLAAQGAFLAARSRGGANWQPALKALAERTLNTDLDWDFLESIGQYAFTNLSSLGAIDLPNVKTCSSYAFFNTYSTGDVNMPELTSCSSNAFREFYHYWSPQSEVTFNLPKVESLPELAFFGSLKLPAAERPTYALNLDSCTSIGNRAFDNQSGGVRRIYAPRLQTIANGNAFGGVGASYPARVPKVELVVGSQELNTGLSMSSLVGLTGFPFGVSLSGRVWWYCKDGTVTYDTAQAAWVQTAYSGGGGHKCLRFSLLLFSRSRFSRLWKEAA